ncbi:MAG: response regulator [Acidimicrobiia bacterium]|nr:MAG: response regulator [Acidimicrobiia bacterium]
MRAIVVDDSKAMRSVLRRMLAECGVEAIGEADNGRVALSLLREHADLDLALVDRNMPEMDGLEFVRQVRADSSLAGITIVMVTSETSAESIGEALDSGVDEYLMKPFTTEALAEKLALVTGG